MMSAKINALTAVDSNPLYASFREFFLNNWQFNPFTPRILSPSTDPELFVHESLVPLGNQAQILRLLYPALFPDQLFLLTDIDMAAVCCEYFKVQTSIPLGQNEIVNLSSDAYPDRTRMPICYFYGSGRTFARITGVTNLNTLRNTLVGWWQMGLGWPTDEVVFGRLLADAESRGLISVRRVERGWTKSGMALRRIDRSSNSAVNSEVTAIDAHLPRPFDPNSKEVLLVQKARGYQDGNGPRLVCFSLHGASPEQTAGAIANARALPNILPDWTPIFFCPEGFDPVLVQELKALGAKIIFIKGGLELRGVWHFLAADFLGVSFTIFRDVDSRISTRERFLILRWMESRKIGHIIRDHPSHCWPILPGMWGLRLHKPFGMREKLLSFSFETTDRDPLDPKIKFLQTIIYPIIENQSLVDDEFFDNTQSLPRRKGLEFVGQKFDANGRPILESSREIAAWELLKSERVFTSALQMRPPYFAKHRQSRP